MHKLQTAANKLTILLAYAFLSHKYFYRSKMSDHLYSRMIIPKPSKDEGTHEFPGRKIQIGGKILPLEDEFDPKKSLDFNKGQFES